MVVIAVHVQPAALLHAFVRRRATNVDQPGMRGHAAAYAKGRGAARCVSVYGGGRVSVRHGVCAVLLACAKTEGNSGKQARV